MATKTINIHSGIIVASAAEVLVFTIMGIIAILIRYYMAVNAFSQAVLGGADAFAHGVITLMHDEFHVILTHLRYRFDAAKFFIGIHLGLGNNRRRYFTSIQGQG